MKHLFLSAALVLALAAPAFATEDAAVVATETPAVAAPTVEPVAPAVEDPATLAAKEACATEIGEKMKLPENASAEEQAQFDAALAECVAGKTPASAEAPAESGEAAADHAGQAHEGHEGAETTPAAAE